MKSSTDFCCSLYVRRHIDENSDIRRPRFRSGTSISFTLSQYSKPNSPPSYGLRTKTSSLTHHEIAILLFRYLNNRKVTTRLVLTGLSVFPRLKAVL